LSRLEQCLESEGLPSAAPVDDGGVG